MIPFPILKEQFTYYQKHINQKLVKNSMLNHYSSVET